MHFRHSADKMSSLLNDVNYILVSINLINDLREDFKLKKDVFQFTLNMVFS